jgi:hypothetical protein
MGRIVLGAEAIAFLKNPQYLYSNKAELIAKAERYQAEGKRFALAIPSKGTPDIYLTPHIEKKKITLPPAEKTTTPTPIAASTPEEESPYVTFRSWLRSQAQPPTIEQSKVAWEQISGVSTSTEAIKALIQNLDGLAGL